MKYDDIKHNPCVHHLRPDATSSHTIQQCHINRDIAKDPKAGKSRSKRKSRKDDKEKEDKHAESLIVNLATDSSRKEKAAWRELNATVPAVPQYLDWSDTHGIAVIIRTEFLQRAPTL